MLASLQSSSNAELGDSSPTIDIELFLCAATSTQMIVSSERGSEGTVGGECCPRSSSYPVNPVGFCAKAPLARNIWSKAGKYLIVTGNFFESIEPIQPEIKGRGLPHKLGNGSYVFQNESRAAVQAPASFVYVQCRPHRPGSMVRTQEEASSNID